MSQSEKQHSIIDINGRRIFLSLDHFINEIAKGDNCFICGYSPEDKEFNDEHIIPKWILRKFNLFNETITLPNSVKYKYSKYTVPCCVECNSDLSKEYETPISELLNKSYSEIVNELNSKPELFELLFKWLNLIYLKTHLKDKEFRFELDQRKDSGKISDMHYWEDMHHIHCVARSHHTGAFLDKKCIGSIFVVPIKLIEGQGEFDYADSIFGKGVLLQLADFCIISVLNDASAAMSVMTDEIKKITGALIPQQAKEILANFNYINLSLKKRPVYHSRFNRNKEYFIEVKLPDLIEFLAEEEQFVTVGGFLRLYIDPMLNGHPDKKELLDEIEAGKRGFLWTKDGAFDDYNKKTAAKGI
jgi:hypothetical protein